MGNIGSTQGVNASAMPSRKKSGKVQPSERSPSHCVIWVSLPETLFHRLVAPGSCGRADGSAGGGVVTNDRLATWIVSVCGG